MSGAPAYAADPQAGRRGSEAKPGMGRARPAACRRRPPYLYFLHSLLTLWVMKAVLTSKGQITIPAAIRRKLGLQAGQVLDFDEDAPYLKAVIAFDEEEMRLVVGCAKGRLGRSSREWLDDTRDQVALPASP